MLSSIPSPSSNTIPILGIHYYGLMIALGVLAAVMLARSRWRAAGHDPDEIADIAVWAVPAGLIGTRVYHVITDFDKYKDKPLEMFAIWNGGLGIPGGIAAGVLAGIWACKHYGIDVKRCADAVIPGLPLAQAIGRLGNYFNQELFGRPTDLPWGLEIAPEHRPIQYFDRPTFHPTFAYEALWNLALCATIILIGRKRVLKPGKLLPIYLIGYGVGRFWVELMRSDEATEILGLRVNTWVSSIMVIIGVVWLLAGGALRPAEERGVDLDAEDAATVADLRSDDVAADLRSDDVAADLRSGVVADDGVVDAGPDIDSPRAEIDVTEGDDTE